MISPCVKALLKDYDAERMRDRRAIQRRPFPRPIIVKLGPNRNQIHNAFSRDISDFGIGTVGPIELRSDAIGWLTISLLSKKSITVKARVQWSEPFGDKWFLTGWEFLDS